MYYHYGKLKFWGLQLVLCSEVFLFSEGPLSEVSLYIMIIVILTDNNSVMSIRHTQHAWKGLAGRLYIMHASACVQRSRARQTSACVVSV